MVLLVDFKLGNNKQYLRERNAFLCKRVKLNTVKGHILLLLEKQKKKDF